MQFIADLERDDDGGLQIMYGIDGRRDLTESQIDELSGYAGAHPVRIGNGAFNQRQNDVFGAALDSVLLHTRRSQRLPRRLWPLIRAQAECAQAVWRKPDQGIWEARGKPQHYVSSKLMCWVAMDRACKLATIRGEGDLAADWSKVADEIKADILEHGVDKRGVLVQHYGTESLDASTLLAALFGFLPATDERLRASVLAIADELTENGFVLRYRTDETDDGLSGKEGTFVICSFWLVSALAIIDEMQRARDLMTRLIKVASPLGLYAEEFDVATGRHLGNFPQAFSHLALVEAAGTIIVAERVEELAHMSDYDVIVIGSGAGGGTLAHRLAPSGKRILLLERGDWLPREPQNWLAQSVFVENRYVSPDTWYYPDGSSFRPEVHYWVGGATKRYGAALYRLRAEDFGVLRHQGRALAGMADLLHGDGAVLHTGRAALPSPRRPRRGPDRTPVQRPVPFPAVSHEPRIQQLSDDLATAGLHPFHAPCGILLDESNMPFSKCVRCDNCDGFPCLVHAKSDAEVIAVRPAIEHPNVTLLTDAEAIRLETQPGRHGRHPRLRKCRGSAPRRSPATSSSSLAARRTAPSYCSRLQLTGTRAGLANSSDQVGRNFMFHNSQAVLALSKEENPTVFQKTLGLNDFYFSGPNFEFPLGNIQMVGKSQAPMFRGEKPGETRFAPTWTLRDVARHAVDFWLSTEDLPRPDNRVTLTKDGSIQISYTASNQEPKERLYHQLKDMLNELGMHHGPPPASPRIPQERNPRRRLRPPSRHGQIRPGSRLVRPQRRLPRPRGRQPVRGRHQLLPEHRRGQPGAHRDGERAAGRRPPARATERAASTGGCACRITASTTS